MSRPPAVQVAVDQLAVAVAALSLFEEAALLAALYRAAARTFDAEVAAHAPQARPVLLALRQLVSSRALADLEHLVSVLEVTSPVVGQAVALHDGGRHPLWTALQDLCRALDEEQTDPTEGATRDPSTVDEQPRDAA